MISRSLLLSALLTSVAQASGLDVQLKDLRGSFVYTDGKKQCRELKGPEIKQYGRLTHCHPRDDDAGRAQVVCPTATSGELHAFETLALCTSALAAPSGSAGDM